MKHHHFLLGLFLSLCIVANAQTRKELEERRKQKQQEIEQTKSFLKENSTKQKKSLSDLQTLARQIKVRQEIINSAAGEINLLSSEIGYLETNIKKLEENLEALKKQYAHMIYEAYKNRNMTDKMSFVFSGKDFNETFQHLNYLQQIGKYSKQKATEITETQNKLNLRIEQLTGTKRTKEELVNTSKSQKGELEIDKKEEAVLLKKLKGKESQMRKDLLAKEQQIRQLDRAIANAINKEIEEARKKALAESESRKDVESKETKTSEKKSTSFTNRNNTEAGNALSADFEKNKNRLPWPVDKGYIIRPFGVHPHPTIPNVKTENNGVDIASNDGAVAKAIFKGEVRAIFPVPGMGTAVLVSHGNYYSVYCKLKSVNITVGSQVAVGTTIGAIMKNEEDDKTELHLEIWKNTEKQNPEAWLR